MVEINAFKFNRLGWVSSNGVCPAMGWNTLYYNLLLGYIILSAKVLTFSLDKIKVLREEKDKWWRNIPQVAIGFRNLLCQLVSHGTHRLGKLWYYCNITLLCWSTTSEVQSLRDFEEQPNQRPNIWATPTIPQHLNQEISLLLPVKICEEFVTKVFARVIEPDLLIDRIDLLNIRRLKLEGNIKVLHDSLWRLWFRDHGTTMWDTPGYGN